MISWRYHVVSIVAVILAFGLGILAGTSVVGDRFATDLQLNYDFNEHFAVSLDAVNLTEEIQKEYYRFADSGGPDIMNFGNVLVSRAFALGFRWKY